MDGLPIPVHTQRPAPAPPGGGHGAVPPPASCAAPLKPVTPHPSLSPSRVAPSHPSIILTKSGRTQSPLRRHSYQVGSHPVTPASFSPSRVAPSHPCIILTKSGRTQSPLHHSHQVGLHPVTPPSFSPSRVAPSHPSIILTKSGRIQSPLHHSHQVGSHPVTPASFSPSQVLLHCTATPAVIVTKPILPIKPHYPSLLSLTVSVDVKQRVYLPHRGVSVP